jgi:hypothetical protein
MTCAGQVPASLRLRCDYGGGKTQSEKFKDAARELEADEDEARWEERLRKVTKQKVDKPE